MEQSSDNWQPQQQEKAVSHINTVEAEALNRWLPTNHFKLHFPAVSQQPSSCSHQRDVRPVH